MNRLTLTASVLLLPSMAFAEDVVITANRYEAPITQTLSAVTVLTEEDIKQYQDSDLGTLLSRLSGVNLVSTGSLGSTSNVLLRGTSSSQVLVLVDGVPSISASTGQTSFASIPLSNIERIEVVRGPVSSLYGANGIGGVIQVFTKSPESAEDDVYVKEVMAVIITINSARALTSQPIKHVPLPTFTILAPMVLTAPPWIRTRTETKMDSPSFLAISRLIPA